MSIRQELICRWVRPYIVRELPAWGKVYSLLIGGWKRDSRWAGAKLKTIRGKLHGYEMTLDISRWSERYTYFLGRFYDLETQLFMKRFLRPGDRVADVGANVGMITLLAARLVGPEGVVEAFEPNPVCQRKVEQALVRNRIGHVRLHGVGLGAETSHGRLSVKSVNSGEGTLTPVDDKSGFDTMHDVRVVRGDSILAIDARALAFVNERRGLRVPRAARAAHDPRAPPAARVDRGRGGAPTARGQDRHGCLPNDARLRLHRVRDGAAPRPLWPRARAAAVHGAVPREAERPLDPARRAVRGARALAPAHPGPASAEGHASANPGGRYASSSGMTPLLAPNAASGQPNTCCMTVRCTSARRCSAPNTTCWSA